jgi:hypothetical protein
MLVAPYAEYVGCSLREKPELGSNGEWVLNVLAASSSKRPVNVLVAPLHLRSPLHLQSPLHLRSHPSTFDRIPPPAIAPLHLRSFSSTCDRSPPPAIAPFLLRSLRLPSTCDRSPPPAIAPPALAAASFPPRSLASSTFECRGSTCDLPPPLVMRVAATIDSDSGTGSLGSQAPGPSSLSVTRL